GAIPRDYSLSVPSARGVIGRSHEWVDAVDVEELDAQRAAKVDLAVRGTEDHLGQLIVGAERADAQDGLDALVGALAPPLAALGGTLGGSEHRAVDHGSNFTSRQRCPGDVGRKIRPTSLRLSGRSRGRVRDVDRRDDPRAWLSQATCRWRRSPRPWRPERRPDRARAASATEPCLASSNSFPCPHPPSLSGPLGG